MSSKIKPFALNHMNIVLEDFDASVEFYRDIYGAVFLHDIPREDFHAGLLDLGGVMYELFVPQAFLFNMRHGPHYLGIEYATDMDIARRAVEERGIRVARDIGVAIHTHPDDCFGVAFEFYSDDWFPRVWPDTGLQMQTPDHWRTQPGGLGGQRSYTMAVHDLDAATRFMLDLFDTEVTFDEKRPHFGAHARGVPLAGVTVELLSPTGDGPLRDLMQRHGQGILSTVYSVSNVEETRAYLESRGLPTSIGSSEGGFAVPAEANKGMMLEFV